MSSPLMDAERTLAVLLGLHASVQARSTELSTEEVEYHHWLEAKFFRGGLQVLQPQDPFDEEKGESRTPSSCPTTPGNFPVLSPQLMLLKADRELCSFEGRDGQCGSQLFEPGASLFS